MSAYPCQTIAPGTRLDVVGSMESVKLAKTLGTDVVIYARGRFRVVSILRTTPTRVQVAFSTPSAPGKVERRYRHVNGYWADRVFFAPSDGLGSYVVRADSQHPRYAHTLANYVTGEPIYS